MSIIVMVIFLVYPQDMIQAKPALLTGKKINKLTILPEDIVSPDRFTEITGIKTGDNLDIYQIRRSYNLLGQLDISNIIVEALPLDGGVELIYNIEKKKYLEKFLMEGNKFFTEKQIKNAAGKIEEPEEITETKITEWTENIQRLYSKKGFFDANITLNLMQIKDNFYNIELKIIEGERSIITQVEYTGDKVLSDIVISFLTSTSKGKYYDEGNLEGDMKSITDYLKDDGYITAEAGPPVLNREGINVNIEIPIKAGGRLITRFVGNKEISTRKISSLLLFIREASYEDSVISNSIQDIISYYKKQGFHFINVSYEKEMLPAETTKLTFYIREGKRIVINDILFKGNKDIDTERLKNIMTLKESTFFKKGYYIKDIFDEDIENLQRFYVQNGYLSAKVMDITGKLFSKGKFRIKVEEGDQTKIGNVIFEGNTVISSSRLKDYISPGMPYIENSVNNDVVNEIKYLYSQKGYVYVDIEPVVKLYNNNTSADVKYKITEDKPAYISRILLTGNEITKDNIIFRELLFKPGDIYDIESILLSKQRLYRRGIFKRVTIESQDKAGDPYQKEMLVHVEEERPGTGSIGTGYGNEEKLKGFFEIGYDNLWGTARSIRFRSEASSIESIHSLNYFEPWFLNKQVDARAGIFSQSKDRNTYRIRQRATNVGLDKYFSDNLRGSIVYQFELSNLSDVKEGAIITEEDEGKLNIASINPSIIHDTRDNPFNPTQGSIKQITVRDAAKLLGSKVQLIKVTGESFWYFKPFGYENIVFATGAVMGAAKKFGETTAVPISERFFLGGRSSVRGYAQDRLGIPGETIKKGTPTGGNAMMQVNAEVRVGLPYKTGIVFFIDGGEVWTSTKDINVSEFKFAVGTGFRYDTLVGPLRIDYGIKLNRESPFTEIDPVTGERFEFRESKSEIHFTLGHAF